MSCRVVSWQVSYSQKNAYTWTDGSKSVNSGLASVSVEESGKKSLGAETFDLPTGNPLRIAFNEIAKSGANFADLSNATIDEETHMVYTHITIEDDVTSLLFRLTPVTDDVTAIDVSDVLIDNISSRMQAARACILCVPAHVSVRVCTSHTHNTVRVSL